MGWGLWQLGLRDKDAESSDLSIGESHHGPEYHLEQSLQPQLRDALLRRQNNEGDAVERKDETDK
jgi:hypothetical protein